jgi:CO dehydrogenase maturation factor
MGRLFRMLFGALMLTDNDLVIVDAAAGVEHFGRGLDGQCDRILCVVDPSYESIMMAQRVTDLAREAKLPVGVVINRVTPEIEEELTAALDGSDILGCLPDSRAVFRSNLKGEPLDPEMPEIETVCKAILETA